MKIGLIGVGQAGGKIVDEFLDYDDRTPGTFVVGAVAINTASSDLHGLATIPPARRILIGQTRVKGHGVGADNDLGAEIAAEDIGEVQGAIDEMPIHDIDAFLVVAGLGGGTGSGGTHVIASHLRGTYNEPVYALGVLPATNEGGIYSLNAARSLKAVAGATDNLLVFDNDAWRKPGESIEASYDRLNDELVRRFGVIFSAGEVDASSSVGQTVVDASEIVNTLASGGISTVGYATAGLDRPRGLLDRLRADADGANPGATRTNRIVSLVRQATAGRLTLPAAVESAERVLLVVCGPPGELNRKGIERARTWLEEETDSLEVRSGDYPLPREDQVGVAVLLSGVTDVPRIHRLQHLGVETKEAMEANRDRSREALVSLLSDDADELPPLY